MLDKADKGLTRAVGGLAAAAREVVSLRRPVNSKHEQLWPVECHLTAPVPSVMLADLLSNKDCSMTDIARCKIT